MYSTEKPIGRKTPFCYYAFLFILFVISASQALAQVPGYSYRVKITINESVICGTTNLVDFPILIKHTATFLRPTPTGLVSNANGYDIVFTAADGTTLLNHQIDHYYSATGEYAAWVRIPSLSATVNTDIYMYYGNASVTTDQSSTATWDATFRTVYHFQSNNLNDGTANAINGTNNGTTDFVTAQIGGGRDLDGSNAYIQTTSSELKTANNFTLSTWFKADQTSVSHLMWQGQVGENGWGDGVATPQGQEMHLSAGTCCGATNNYLSAYLGHTEEQLEPNGLTAEIPFTNTTNWHYLVGTWTNLNTTPTIQLYLDGALVDSDAGTVAAIPRDLWDTNLRIGRPGQNQRYFNGQMDETRIANVSRSADWICTEYATQNSTAGLTLTNDPPDLGSIEGTSINYVEDDPATQITNAITITDENDGNLTGATIQITGNYVNTEDVLAFTSAFGVTGTFSAATGILTLTGTTTLANYRTLLRSVTYQNTNLATPSTLVRTVSFRVTDGTANSNIVTRNINVTQVNDAPVLAAIEATALTYTEAQAATVITATTTVTDIDNTNLTGATISITSNFASGEDVLAFTNAFGITGSWNSGTGVLTLTGTTTVANYQSALRAITYQNTSSNPSTATRTVQFRVTDGTTNSNIVSRNITVISVNPYFNMVGNTTELSTYCFTITPAVASSYGSLWRKVPTTLTSSFEINFDARFSANGVVNNGGADGIVFVLQRDFTPPPSNAAGVPTDALGNNGVGLGYGGISPAIGVTFDTYTNAGQPNYDFIALSKDGNITPVLTPEVAAKVDGSNNPLNIEDGVYHPVKITWEKSTNTLKVFFDGVQRVSYSEDFINTIFGGDPTNIYWGFTAATGGFFNEQGVCGINMNFAPTTVADSYTVPEGGTLNPAAPGVLSNDTDAEGGPLTAAIGVLPVNGTLTLNANGSFTYVHNGSETTSDSFTYRAFDGSAYGDLVTVSITVTPVNDAPVLAAMEAGALAYSEGQAATVMTSTTTVTDADNANLTGATIQITGNYLNGEDVLAFTNAFGITGTFTAATGTLTLTGTTTVANYQAAIRTITYQNTNNNNPSTLTRTVSFRATDGTANSNVVTRDIAFTAVNDAPVLAAIEGTALAYTEGQAATAITATTTVTDVDNTNLTGATIQITGNYQNGEDVLAFTSAFGITGTFTAATGTLTLTGTTTVANYQTAIRAVTYQNTNNNNPSALTRTVSYTVTDGSLSSNTVTRNITFTAVNDAPVLAAIEAAALAYSEGQAATVITATTTAVDVDNANLTGATIQITGNYLNGEDVLAFTNAFGITGTFTAATGTLALTGTTTVANYQAAIRTITYQNTNNNNPSALTRTVSFTVTDGSLNSNTVTRDIAFTAVNDVPVLAAIEGAALAYTEGQAATAITSTTTVSDVDNVNLTGATIQITGNYANGEDVLAFTAAFGITGTFTAATGTLTLTGTTTLANYQSAIRAITYQNTNNNNPSALTRTVSFTVNDGSGNSNTVTRDITFTAVNDAPVLAAIEAAALPYSEGQAATIVTATTTATDVDNVNLTGATIQITGNYANGEDVLAFTSAFGITGTFTAATGTLTLTGTTTVANYQSAIRAITYQNTNNNNPSALTRTVSFTVTDGSLSSNTVTRNITFTAVNDAPVLAAIEAAALAYTEGQAATAITATTTITDVDNTNLNGATIQITGNYQNGEDVLAFTSAFGITGTFTAATGTLTLTGTTTVANYQSAIRAITYQNTNNNNPSALTRTVSFTVNDGSANSNTVTRDITFTAVNDAPVLAAIEAAALAYSEGQAATAMTATTTVTDVDNVNLTGATIQITGNYQNGEDVLAFTSAFGITGTFTAATGTLALTGTTTVANYQSAIRAITYQNTNNNNPSALTRTVSFTVTDGSLSSNTVTRDITFTAINDAPVLAAIEGAALAYTEGQAATVITSTTTVADVDNANLTGATIQITGNYANGEDVLAFTSAFGITGTFTAATGTLTLTGTTTVANYQSAIRAITYQNTNNNNPSTLTRTVSFTVTDGSSSSNTVTRNITFTAVNDAPVLAAIEAAALAYTEGQAATVITATTTVTDVDNANLTGATIQITGNYLNGEDVLAFTSAFGITGTFTAATGTLTLTGTTTVANYQSAIRAVTYQNTNNNNPSTLTRTVSFTVTDGALSSNTVTRDITFTAVNDAPVLAAIEAAALAYSEGQAATAITATTTVTDVDNANLTGATIQITGNYMNGEDVLAFTSAFGITGTFTAATGTLTLTGTTTVANYQSAIRAITYQNTNNNNPSALTRTVSFTVNDGTTNSNTVTRNITFTAVNDAPVLAAIEAAPLAYSEGQAATVITATTTVNDVDNTNLTGATIQITGNYLNGEDVLAFTNAFGITGTFTAATGTLTLTGTTSVANYQSALRTVTYQNTNNSNPSTLTRTVSFTVNDGTANSNTVTRDITFTGVNDAPVLAAIEVANLAYSEGQAATAITATTTATDVDNVNLTGATIQITGNYASGEDVLAFTSAFGITGTFTAATGTLTLTGTTTVANYQTAIRAVTYQNTNNNNPSTLTRTVSYTVTDGALSSNTVTRDITFTAVNDAPVLAAIEAAAVPYSEGQAATIITATTTATDVDNANLTGATIQITGNYVNGEDVLAFTSAFGITGTFTAATGTLTLTGTTTVANYQAAIRAITYQDTNASNPSTLTRTVSFAVNDGSANSNTVTRNISFSAVNDAPVLAAIEAAALAYTEGQAATAITSTTTATDPDNVNLSGATIQITGNYATGEDVLAFTSAFGITGTFTAATGTLTLTGTTTVANYQSAIRAVTYQNTNNNNPSALTRTVSYTVTDGALSSNTVTRDITFTAVNDAPVLAAIEAAALAYSEGQVATALTSTTTVTDVDNTNLTGATIQITGNYANGEDVLAFTSAFGITGTFTAATGTLTLTGTTTVANYQSAIRAITYQNTNNNNPSTLTRTVSFTVNDGTANSNTVTRNITFTAVNDAPVLAAIEAAALMYSEGQVATVVTATTTVSDVDNTNLTGATIQITGNYANGEDVLVFTSAFGITGTFAAATGTLTLTGTTTVANYQSAIRAITYQNTNNNSPSALTRTVSFTVSDGAANSNTVTRDIVFTAVNDASVLAAIEGTSLNYTEGQAATAITSTTTVNDVDNTTLTGATIQITGNYVNGEDVLAFTSAFGITGTFDAATGTLTLTGSATLANYQAAIRSITYQDTNTDNPSTLTRTVSFTVNDGTTNSNTVTRTITFTAVNDAPVLAAIEGTPLSYTEGQAATAITSTTTVNDVDNANLTGATIQITGNYVNGEDVLAFTSAFGITGTFSAATGTLTLTGTTTLANYQSAIRAITYQNTNNNNPSALTRTVSFTVNDGTANSNTVTRDIAFTAVNDAPVANNDNAITTPEDTPISIAVLSNDTDADNALDPATVTVTGGPTNGTFTINNTTGAITYTPNLNYNGGDSFTYTVKDASGLVSNTATVTLTVTPVNDAPVSANDSYNTNEDTPLTVTAATGVLSNDTDADGNTITAALVSTTTNGTLALNPDGSFTYTPTLGFNGTDSFTYRANDGTTNSAVSTVTITVNPVNNPPVANNDNATTPEDVAIAITVLSNDTDSDDALNPSSVAIVANPANGTVSINATTGVITYTPNSNYNGNDSFTYTVRDATGAVSNTATVTITVTPVNDAPVAVGDNATTSESVAVVINILANDSDVDDGLDATSVSIVSPVSNGTLTVNPTTGAVTYTPNAGFIGNDSFTYTVEDASGTVSNTVTVAITVSPVNDPPVAADDGQIDYNSLLPLTIDVISNDNDPDNLLTDLTIISVTQPSSGTVTIVNGELVYTPDATTSGLITFTYTIQDPGGLTATATVTLFVEIIPLKISQGFSPNNGDADNNTWYIESIESYPNNSIKVYDRWGLLVYQAKHYDNLSVVWNGSANTGQQSGKELDQGTYYYIVDLGNSTKALTGYVVIAK